MKTYLQRDADSYLTTWKHRDNRRVLLVRGARQVGKTSTVREFGRSFKFFIEINFEKQKEIHQFFQDSLNIDTICSNLSTYYKKPIIKGETLLFFDEIQSCPNAIRSLRFFYEDNQQLHVIAAGSLLEFALFEIPSFGVGRIESLYMYPLSFCEFLNVTENNLLIKKIDGADFTNPVHEVFHRELIELLRIYLMIGGMPEVINEYVKTKDINGCQIIIDSLLDTFRDDFAKYKKRSPVLRLSETFSSVAYQAGKKFKYSNVSNDEKSIVYKEALNLLEQAGLVYKIYHTSANGIPLGSEIDTSRFKVIPFDLGLNQRLIKLDLSQHILKDGVKLINEGSLAESFVGLELVAYSPMHTRTQLYYWHRETRTSNAEVDYVFQKNEKIIPIEIKAGLKGQMQSMKLFLEEKKRQLGIRISQENFSQYQNIRVVPIYAVKRLYDLI